MQTIAALAKRLDMSAEKAVEVLRHMLFDVNNVESEISDEACDLLIDVDENPDLADKIRNNKLKEIQRAQEAEKKAEKRKAAARKKAAETKKKDDDEVLSDMASETATLGADILEPIPVPVVEHNEEPVPVVEPVVVIAEPVVIEPEPLPVPEPVAQPIPPEPQKVVAEIVSEPPKPKVPSIVIGKAIEHDARVVEVVRADGTRLDLPEVPEEVVEAPAPIESVVEDEEHGLLAEAQRRQEEEDRRRAKTPARPLPQPDPAVVAEVIRRAAERGQRVKEQKAQKQQKVLKQTGRTERPEVILAATQEEVVTERRSSNTGKTARKRQKKVEKARTEEALRREAAMTLREYQASGTFGAPKKHKRKRTHDESGVGLEEGEERGLIEVGDRMTVEELANAMEVPVNDIILDLMDLEILATKNQTLSLDIIRQLADRRDYDVKVVIPEENEIMSEEPDDPADLVTRAPVVTVMGHVDHGKTTLLDVVRSANVAAGEAGGITQHIAAYDVPIKGGRVVFLDTPGHEAFTQMRARGAKVTDVVVLVVAADDGVMPQTIEAIDHAMAAEVPIVVAINKCDKPDAQPDRIRQELTAYGLLDEQWGGKTIMKNISAKNREGVDELMELLHLESDLLELKANPKKRGRGVVVESEITRGMGPVAWVLVQNGTLRVGDVFLAGESYGRVRTLQNARGENITEAPPATPVVVTGFNVPPEAGTSFVVVEEEKVARAIAEKRAALTRMKQGPTARHITLEDFHERMLAGEKHSLNVVLKADVQGSVDVFRSSLSKLGNEEVSVSLVHAGVGTINESDVLLASASDAVIIGFHVTASARVMKIAEQEGVSIRTYRVIYEAINDVHAALEGMLTPESKETVVGHAEIRQVFRSSAIGNIAGCYMQDGEVTRGSLLRVVRDGTIVFTGRLQTLRRGKDDVKTVTPGMECGIKVENFDDVKNGDILEFYVVESVAKVLQD